MAFTKIVESDLTGKGVTGLPDTPGLSTTAMQEKFDELSIDVVVPKHNGLIDELEADTAAASLGAVDANGNPSTVQAELNYIKEGGYTKEEADALLALKVDKEDGKGLSQYDFSQGYKDKLDGIEDNANNYVLPAGTQSTLGGVMGDGTTFTIDSNGVGHAVGGGGGTADYNALVNKPEINGVEVIGTKESEDYGILRPYLLITSEAGSTVTIKKGTTIIPATQVAGSTTQWEVCPTSYGTWTVKSVLAGADDASATVTVDAVKTYDVTVSHISATITATYPAGATYCTCSKGSTVYTATSNPQTFTVHSLGTWTVETEIDGIVKSATATISADGDSQSVTIEFAEIEVTYASAFAGEVVTCTDGVSTYTKTAPVGGSTLSFAIPNTGTWTVSATVGGTLYTYSVSVVAYTTYTVAMATFSATITVTFPYSEGASCSITDGVTTLTATSSPMAFNVPNTGSWQATAVLDGVSKAGQSITITTDGQTETDTIEYGEIDLTYDNEFRGASITCVNGGTTITKTAPSGTNAMTFYPPTTGTWVISGTYSGTPYSTNATVSSLSTPVSASLQTLPNGKTITPTDDIQIWLACGQISGKSYTTLAEVLADTETYTRLLSDSNACDYMARSTTWALAPSEVPNMTSDTTPSGTVTEIGHYGGYYGYKAFNDEVNGWITYSARPQIHTGDWVAYEFTSPVIIKRASMYTPTQDGTGSDTIYGRIEAYDGSSWTPVSEVFSFLFDINNHCKSYVEVNTSGVAYSKYRWICTTQMGASAYLGYGLKIDLYTQADITTNADAMFQLGKYDYACDALLADSTWASAICNSPYFESVLDVKVPTMTSNTTPSGVCSSSSNRTGYSAYQAFVGSGNSWISNGTATGWVKYEFPSAVVAKVVQFTVPSDGGNQAKTLTVEGSNDDSTYTPLYEQTTDTTAGTTYTIPIPTNTTADKYYRWSILTSSSTYGAGLKNANVYGRHEAHAGKVIHTAYGNETVYYMNGGSPVTVCTATDGVGTFNLPAGTYTLYSTTAKDPANLSDDYSKTVTITNNTTDIYLMPDNALYWYGWKSSNYEKANTANGWSISSRTIVDVTENTTEVIFDSTYSSTECGVGTKNTVSANTVHAICKTTELQSSSGLRVGGNTSKTPAGTYYSQTALNTMEHVTQALTGSNYLFVWSSNGRDGVLDGLWFE